MLIVMSPQATPEQIDQVVAAVEAMGLIAEPIPGSLRTAIGVLGNQGYVDDSTIRNLPGVRETIHVSKPYKLASRDFHPLATIVDVGGVRFGNGLPPDRCCAGAPSSRAPVLTHFKGWEWQV